MGCDSDVPVGFCFHLISIHAPAWGATFNDLLAVLLIHNFNPRTRMGCDKYERMFGLRAKNFNPRTRMGCDTRKGLGQDKKIISIHAPAWGAT